MQTTIQLYFCSRPFNRATVKGMIGYFIIQFLLLHCYYAGLIPCFSFFVGSCHYLGACCRDVSKKFENIDEESTKSNESKIKSKLTDIVLLHIRIIEYSISNDNTSESKKL